jgi:hypothetical protein
MNNVDPNMSRQNMDYEIIIIFFYFFFIIMLYIYILVTFSPYEVVVAICEFDLN